MDYDSDASDTYAEFSNDIISELEENSQIESISKFKEYISHEPEFCGINNISSFDILHIIKNPRKTKFKRNFYISEYQCELLEDICMCVFSRKMDKFYYYTIANQIFSRIYV